MAFSLVGEALLVQGAARDLRGCTVKRADLRVRLGLHIRPPSGRVARRYDLNYGLSQALMTVTTTTSGPTLAIGEIARVAGFQPSAIRYYERRGLLPAPQRSSGRRRYDARVLQLLRVIEVSKAAGFSLREIKQLLHGFDLHTPPSQRWQALVEEKLTEIDSLIARAERMRTLLVRGLECGCLTLDDCQLLQ